MGKKIISFIIFVTLFLFVTGSIAFCDNSPTVSIGTATATKGGLVELPVILSGCSGFASLGFEVDYDESALTLVDVITENTGALFVPAQNLSVKPYILTWTTFNDDYYNGVLVTMQFRINSDAAPGKYDINIDYFKGKKGDNVDGVDVNHNASYEPLCLTYSSGTVTVAPGITVNVKDKTASFVSDDTLTGKIFVTLYDSNEDVVDIKIFDAKETIDFTSDKTGSFATVMWWASVDGSLQPVCDKIELSLQ